MKPEDVKFVIICKPRVILTSSTISDFPIEIKETLEEYHDIVVDNFSSELP